MPDATIEIDRSGPEALVHLKNAPGTFTVTELRMYAEYLATVAREAEKPPPEPDVEALVATLAAVTEARYMTYESALLVLAALSSLPVTRAAQPS